MPRRARPRHPPGVLRLQRPAPRVCAASLSAWCSREAAALAVPPDVLAVRLQAIVDRLHAMRTAPRAPSPAAVLEWLDATDAAAEALARLVPPAVASRLVPTLDAGDVAAIDRLRLALASDRWRHIAAACTATGGRPRTGAPEARAELERLAAECFVPALRGHARRRFVAWVMRLARSENGGQPPPCSRCLSLERMPT